MDSSKGSDTTSVIVKCSGCDRVYRVHTERVPAGVSSFSCRACGSLLPFPSSSHPDGSTAPADDGASCILLVVNEEELAALIRRILETNGYRVLAVSTGEATLQAIRENTVDLLLINVFLPDMMGFELLDRIRQEDGRNDIPSILLSSVHHATRYKRAPTSLYGANDYLERHHLPDLLVSKIRRLLEERGEEQEPVNPSHMPALSDEQVLQRRELEKIENRPPETGNTLEEEMLRMCRVIAGDIALYNEDLIRSTEPDQLLNVLGEDLREGEALLEKKFQGTSGVAESVLREEIELLLRSRGIEIP